MADVSEQPLDRDGADINVLKACNSTLLRLCRLAILPHVLRLTSLIRSAITGWTTRTLSSEEAVTVVFGGYDRVMQCSVRQRHGAKSNEERPLVLSSKPDCLLLRVNATRFSERGPPTQDDGNLTRTERGVNRIKASAA